jgi:hypothetical protein
MIGRYKNRPITPVDAALWDGTNLERSDPLPGGERCRTGELLRGSWRIPGCLCRASI